VPTPTNSLEQLEARYDQVLTDLDALLSKIDSTILKNKPIAGGESSVATEVTQVAKAHL
jgi:hypothetical protein